MSARRSKVPLGPPVPNPMIVVLRNVILDDPDPLAVAAAAIAYVDASRAILPVGGGLSTRGRAFPYAEAVIDALTVRGMISPAT